MSFREKATLSMVAGKERQHGERVARVGNGRVKVLPAAAIFGGNASGKSNFCSALDFARKLVVGDGSPKRIIPAEPFILDPKSEKDPSSFALVLAIGEAIYEYSFKVTKAAVEEEKLLEVGSTAEKVLFSRNREKIVFHRTLPEKERLRVVSDGTRDNQLFLTNSVWQKIETFKPIYDWFDDSLVFIGPNHIYTGFGEFMDEEQPSFESMNQALSLLDTGIDCLGGEEFSLENLPRRMKEVFLADIKEGKSKRLPLMPDGELIIATRKGGELQAKKMVAYHAKADGGKAKLEMLQESDGTRRVIDLLPAFIWMLATGSTKVLVIDELDRSLHTLLTQKLLDYYFSNCSKNSRTQLLFTTHDVMLMDQQLLRRDEIWVTERSTGGASTLTSLWEYEGIRADTDIRKSYLNGRLGGIPRVLLDNALPGFFGKTKGNA
jgi:AAA15 family ATPase/GTPase